jgi:hypothetical protein
MVSMCLVKNYPKSVIFVSMTLAIMITTISVNIDTYAQVELKNQNKTVIDAEQLSMMLDYCIKHAGRSAAGENVTDDLVLSGSLPANFGNITCALVEEINSKLGSSFSLRINQSESLNLTNGSTLGSTII